MSGWTKGPWTIYPGKYPGIDAKDVSIIVFGGDGEYEGVHGGSEGETEANARLISAAPDMAEALKNALKILEDHLAWSDGTWIDDEEKRVAGCVESARAALRKAKGE